jgi:telomere length regulation protein
MTLIEHLSTVAAVWCEEIFVSKTAPVQQQYVAEFLLYPLEQQILTQDSIQLGLDDSGASLSSMLIQVSLYFVLCMHLVVTGLFTSLILLIKGISFRLEVSRADSIRRDGMRAAEAVAHIFGQTLSFDELHQEENNSNESKEVVAKSEPKKKTKEKKSKVMRPKPIALLVVDPDAEVFSDESSSESNDSSSESGSEYSNNSDSSWGEDSLEPYRMDDDEEDLRRVPRPRSLRDCVAYLLTNNEDREAFDKHEAALQELPTLISSRPLDLMDVVPTLVRVLLHMEDKFNMDGFSEHRWDSLMACAVEAPVETCFKLVEEMKGHVSLGTRLEALSVIGCSAEELSGTTSLKERRQIKEENR